VQGRVGQQPLLVLDVETAQALVSHKTDKAKEKEEEKLRNRPHPMAYRVGEALYGAGSAFNFPDQQAIAGKQSVTCSMHCSHLSF